MRICPGKVQGSNIVITSSRLSWKLALSSVLQQMWAPWEGEGGRVREHESESSSADIINYRPVAPHYQELLPARVVMGLIGQDWCSFGNQDWQYLRLYSCITGYRVLVCICKLFVFVNKFESGWLLFVGHLNDSGLFCIILSTSWIKTCCFNSKDMTAY